MSSANEHRVRTAKRAYLSIIANPPAVFSSPTSASSAVIRPYDGPDAQAIIQNVNSRGQNPTRGHNARSASLAVASQRTRSNGSVASLGGLAMGTNGNSPTDLQAHAPPGPISPIGREGSPSLPTLPSHPTLDALINSSLGDGPAPPTDPAILAMSPHTSGPRIGDPGKRMLGAALGVRHPGLPPRQVGNADHAMKEIQRAMGGLTVAE